MSIGSLYESLNHLIDAEESGYINAEQLQEGRGKIEAAIKITRGYLRYLSDSDTLREPISH